MLKVSVVTDEISADIETALELASDWGIRCVELRGVGEQRIGSLDDYHYELLRSNLRRFGMRVCSISPGIFKIPFPADSSFEGHTVLRWQDRRVHEERSALRGEAERHLRELLPRSIGIALELGTSNVGVFSFNRPASTDGTAIPRYVVDYLGEAAQTARSEGATLLLENEHICWGSGAREASGIIESVGSPSLRLNWDPGNAFFAGERPYPDGYSIAKAHIAHVHMKDAVARGPDGEMAYAVRGEIDWEGQIGALLEDGYEGYVSIETHCRPKARSARETLDRILRIAGPGALETA